MKSAFETIVEIIRNKVAVMNIVKLYNDHSYDEALERFIHELNGMLVCLKNINDTDRFYNVNYYADRYEFGYYDSDSNWVVVE